MDLGLRDATAVVTGGSSGMGRAAAECLADDGARVAVFARRKDELDETVAALRERGSPDPVGLVGGRDRRRARSTPPSRSSARAGARSTCS